MGKERTRPQGTFRADLSMAARAWKTTPALPLVTTGLLALEHGVLATLPKSDLGVRTLTLVLLNLGFAGFVGTQRIWYQRSFQGERLTPSEPWTLTWAFLGRFTVLGSLQVFTSLPVTIGAGPCRRCWLRHRLRRLVARNGFHAHLCDPCAGVHDPLRQSRAWCRIPNDQANVAEM